MPTSRNGNVTTITVELDIPKTVRALEKQQALLAAGMDTQDATLMDTVAAYNHARVAHKMPKTLVKKLNETLSPEIAREVRVQFALKYELSNEAKELIHSAGLRILPFVRDVTEDVMTDETFLSVYSFDLIGRNRSENCVPINRLYVDVRKELRSQGYDVDHKMPTNVRIQCPPAYVQKSGKSHLHYWDIRRIQAWNKTFRAYIRAFNRADAYLQNELSRVDPLLYPIEVDNIDVTFSAQLWTATKAVIYSPIALTKQLFQHRFLIMIARNLVCVITVAVFCSYLGKTMNWAVISKMLVGYFLRAIWLYLRKLFSEGYGWFDIFGLGWLSGPLKTFAEAAWSFSKGVGPAWFAWFDKFGSFAGFAAKIPSGIGQFVYDLVTNWEGVLANINKTIYQMFIKEGTTISAIMSLHALSWVCELLKMKGVHQIIVVPCEYFTNAVQWVISVTSMGVMLWEMLTDLWLLYQFTNAPDKLAWFQDSTIRSSCIESLKPLLYPTLFGSTHNYTEMLAKHPERLYEHADWGTQTIEWRADTVPDDVTTAETPEVITTLRELS